MASDRQCCCALVLGLVLFDAGHTEAPAEIVVRPTLCITDERTSACDLEVDIEWRADIEDRYCVRADDAEQPLRCWNDEQEGETEDARRVETTVEYHLEQGKDEAAVAAARIEVLRKDPEDRRRRRRTRYVWDVL